MDGPPSRERQKAEHNSFALERFLATTFDKLPAQTKVLIRLFGALNSASDLTERLELAEKVWEIVRFVSFQQACMK